MTGALKNDEYEMTGSQRTRECEPMGAQKIDAYKMTGSQETREYEMTGARKIDAYKLKVQRKLMSTR